MNWRDVLGDVAATFSFPEAELWAMPIDRLLFWHGQAVRIAKREARR